jgi:hypothetical protein
VTDRDYAKSALIIGGVIFLIWLAHHKPGEAAPPANLDPMQSVFGSDPGAFMPPQDININIGNQGLNYLSNKFIPLFGFVGMAQGTMFQ